MFSRSLCFLVLLLPGFVLAQDDAKPKSVIRFPAVVSQPAPDAVAKLPAGVVYVVEADTPYLLWASPNNLVTVTDGTGPVKIFARFLDGGPKSEWREFKAKQVFILEASGVGTVELIFSAVGSTKASEAIRKTIDVDSGQGPIPPPGPDPEPEPTDSIWPALKSAWQKEVNKTARDKLANIYEGGVRTAQDTSVGKVIQLKDIIKLARKNSIGEALPLTRQVLNDESERVLPVLEDAILTKSVRDLSAATFQRYADLLRRLP